MAISLPPLCVMAAKRSIELCYPGGLPAFRRWHHQYIIEDEWLIGVDVSDGGLHEILNELVACGLYEEQHVAVGRDWAGPCEACPGIAFIEERLPNGSAQWHVEMTDGALPLELRPPPDKRHDPYPGASTCFGGRGEFIVSLLPGHHQVKGRAPISGPPHECMLAAHDIVEMGLRQGLARAMARRGETLSGPDDETSEEKNPEDDQ